MNEIQNKITDSIIDQIQEVINMIKATKDASSLRAAKSHFIFAIGALECSKQSLVKNVQTFEE